MKVLTSIVLSLLVNQLCFGGIGQFFESFDGTGFFSTINDRFNTLDNAGWEIVGNGEFDLSGYAIKNTSAGLGRSESDTIARFIDGPGSFVHRVEITDVELAVADGLVPPGSGGVITFHHQLDNDGGFNTNMRMILSERRGDPEWDLDMVYGGEWVGGFVPSGSDIALEMHFDEANSEVSFSYDNDVNDDLDPILFGPLEYSGTVSERQATWLKFQAWELGTANGIVEHWSFMAPDAGMFGDFDDSGKLDHEDIDLLSSAIRSGSEDRDFDLTADGIVDGLDKNRLVRQMFKSYFGDSNLDGEFNSNDMVIVFQSAEYEDDIEGNSSWVTGDWNGDTEFNSRDLVFAFQDGGYEVGPRAGVTSVPEPTGLLFPLLITGLLICLKRNTKPLKYESVRPRPW